MGILAQLAADCGHGTPTDACPKGSGGAAGSTCTTDADLCLTCPKGKYGDQKAQESCTTCAKGKYSAAAGATVCTACSKGKNTTAAGATALANCTSGSGGGDSSPSSSSTAGSGAVARFSALAITSLLALIAM